MHSTILALLKRYVQTQYDHSIWVQLMELSGLETLEFDHKTVCPDEHVYALVGHAAAMTELSAGELHEKFGEYPVPDLMYIYQKLLRPERKMPDMLENTELTMHKQVRQGHTQNSPPVLEVTRLGPQELMIDYVPPRRMSGLAVGIVRGVAAYCDEADRIDALPTPYEDGEWGRIHVRHTQSLFTFRPHFFRLPHERCFVLQPRRPGQIWKNQRLAARNGPQIF